MVGVGMGQKCSISIVYFPVSHKYVLRIIDRIASSRILAAMAKKSTETAVLEDASVDEVDAPLSPEQQFELRQEQLSDLETNAASIRALDAFLADYASRIRERILSKSGQTERGAGGDIADRAAVMSALDVHCREISTMTAELHRIEEERRLIAESLWRGLCTNGDCKKKIPMARLAYVPGTTVCRDCAGGDRKHR
jgi:RNA polymerase-binding transcription factor DksA